MGLDVDFVFADAAIDELKHILSRTPHGEREEIRVDLVKFADDMKKKYSLYAKDIIKKSDDSGIIKKNSFKD